jgi:hypothetical protein
MNRFPIGWGACTVQTTAPCELLTFIDRGEMVAHFASEMTVDVLFKNLESRVQSFVDDPKLVERLRLFAQDIVAQCVATALTSKSDSSPIVQL